MSLSEKWEEGFDKDTPRVYNEEDVKKSIKNIVNEIINDWEFCKKANCEPHIHPRKVIEIIVKEVGKELIDDLKLAGDAPK